MVDRNKNNEEQRTLNSAERAAVLMISLGEESASEVMKHIKPKQVHKISAAMASMANVSKEEAIAIITKFNLDADNETSLGVGTHDYLRNVLINALGEERASTIIDRVLMGGDVSGIEQLKWLDPRGIVEIIKLEHPQIIAVILSYLESDLAADVLSLLPENTRTDIILRISTLDGIQPSAINELNEVISGQFTGKEHVKSSAVGGVKTAANILNLMDTSIESLIVDQISDYDVDLAEQIQDLMFVFDDLGDVDDRGIQSLMREVSSETLVVALKGANDRVKEKIFKNMSKRASEMLADDLEAKGPVKISEVEAAQKEIITIARRLSEAGDIVLGGKESDGYL